MMLLILGIQTRAISAQPIDRAKGVDPRIDYAALVTVGPWDDRNYALTQEDLALLSPNEHEQHDPVPAFFRVEMRKANPKLRREGPAQYPRSALQIFQLKYGGYLIEGKIYRGATYRNGRFQVVREKGIPESEWIQEKALAGEVRVTSPSGAAESAIKINHVNPAQVVAGSNGPGTGQVMHRSTDGGATWAQAAALPLGSTCCDPTVDWSYNGTKAYTATLGNCGSAGCGVWFYRSGDGGATWSDLGADPRRELTNSGSDKEYLHVDKFGTSPYRDNIYLTWHDTNNMRFARSTDFGQTWSTFLTLSSGSAEYGIGSDIATDKNGAVYYFWPAFNSRRILVRKSTNGGVSFNPVVQAGTTNGSYEFPIPAMETRRAFIYVTADVDTTNGPFANRIYAAWTDSTAVTSSTPTNNHARIQVAYSSDGGATWTVRTPHPTADQGTVDRFHPWLAVGTDGTVYVAYYDTRHSVNRTGVDFYYSKSSDGGNTWSTPARLTSVTSPNVTDSFEWGDYNGLDVVASQFLSVFTDNRHEGGGTGNSVDIYAAAATTSPPVPTGQPYTLSPAPSSSYPDSGGELTNGVTATGESWVNAAGWLNVNPTITWDLGQIKNLTGIQLYVGNSFGNGSFGVYRPASTTVSVSSDGVSFTPVGSLSFSAWSDIGTKNQVDRGAAAVNASGRFVRFTITAGGPWVMVTEITATTSGGGSLLSAGKPYGLSPAPASNYPDSGGELTNGITATGESWINAAGWLNVNPTITLDLGQVYNLTEIHLYVGNSFGTGSFGVYRPASTAISVSSDGVSYTPLGNLSFSAWSDIGTKNQVDRGSAAVSATGRWIRFAITAGGPWVMVTEMAASGSP